MTPAVTRAMVDCGADLLGFDQLTADDGRLAATVWSWAEGQPSGPGCVLMRKRFRVASCAAKHRFACRAADGALTRQRQARAAGRSARGAAAAPSPAPGTRPRSCALRAGGKAVWLKLRR